jgi:hypothetical protein
VRARARKRGQGPNTGNPTKYHGGGGNHGGRARRAHAQKKKKERRRGGAEDEEREASWNVGSGQHGSGSAEVLKLRYLPRGSAFWLLASEPFLSASRFSRLLFKRLKILAGVLAVGF